MAKIIQLSPQKYIETKARLLPIYKCMVNKDWQEDKMANVVVMRRHITGNITVGIYLIDLLCLGIKDTFYIFNEQESLVMERLSEVARDIEWETIDYELAHNIVYAGYDFAMEFHIEPCKDFALTKYILEEDNDDTPLLDIPVGDKDGKPVLMTYPGQFYPDALAKLKKYAGEGNYSYYTEEEDDDEYSIDDFEYREINAWYARDIRLEELMAAGENGKFEERDFAEVCAMNLELIIRTLRAIVPDKFNDDENREEYRILEQLEQRKCLAFGISTEEEEECFQLLYSEIDDVEDGEIRYETISNAIKKHADKPLVLIQLYFLIAATRNNHALLEKAWHQALMPLADTYPLARLYIVADEILTQAETGIIDNAHIIDNLAHSYGNIINNTDIREAFPNVPYEEFGNFDFNAFWLIQALVHALKKEYIKAIMYYDLAVDADPHNSLTILFQPSLIKEIGEFQKNEAAKYYRNIQAGK